MALGMFAEKQVASKCGDALVVEHMDVFQHLFGLGAKTVERSGIDLVEVVVEGVAVKVLERSVAYGCCVGLVAARVLKQGEYLRVFRDAAFVGSLFHPYLSVEVFVGLVLAFFDGTDQKMLLFQAHYFGLDVDRGAYLLIGCIAQFATDDLYLFVRQAHGLAAFVLHAKEDHSALGVGKGYHLLCDLPLRSKRFFKLHFGGLATKTQVLKSIFRHNAIPSVVVSYLLCFPQNYNFFLNRLSFSEEMCTNTLQGEAMGLLHRYFLYSEA